MTQMAIAKKLGISRTRVAQVEQNALNKFRRAFTNDPYLAEWVRAKTSQVRRRKAS